MQWLQALHGPESQRWLSPDGSSLPSVCPGRRRPPEQVAEKLPRKPGGRGAIPNRLRPAGLND